MSLPEAPKRQRRRCWFHASTVTVYVKTRSKVGWFWGHWVGGAARCPGIDLCSVCASGAERRLFTYVFIELERGEVMVFEIPERLHHLSKTLDEAVGTTLAISRDGTARNSRINILDVGLEDADELDVWPFVNSLGLNRISENAGLSSTEKIDCSEART